MLEPQSRHHVLSCEGECLGLNMPPFPWRAPAAPRALGPSVLRPTTQRPERQSLEAASWPSRLYSWVEHQDPWGFALESLLAFVPAGPLLCPGRSSPTASQGSLGPAGAQGCLWLASPPKRVPLCAAAWFGWNVPSFPKQARAACSEAGPGGLDGSPTKAQNQSLGAASWQSVFDSVLEHQAQRGLLCNITLALVPPRPPWGLGRCRPSAAQSPLGPAWVPGLSVA